METTKSSTKVLKIMLKDFTINHTITSLAKEAKLTRVGMWKVIKKLGKEKFILLSPIGKGKTSTYVIYLNWENSLVEKSLSLALTEEALKQQRWMSNFSELENKPDFIIIYGSIIYSPKEANDIDILTVANKKNFRKIDEAFNRIQKTQIKKIHALNFTQKGFKQELKKPNKAFIDIVKKGIILFGQEKFIKFMKSISKK